MTIQNVLKGLSPPHREQIMYAFENEMSNLVEYETGKFIGVNISSSTRGLKFEDQAGVWSIGLILKGRV